MAGTRHDVVVVGGGLAGLTAATTAARQGADVLLLEARSELGGRARTEDHGGWLLNQGAHALFRAGAAVRVLRELGVAHRGHIPTLRGARWIQGDHLTPATRPSAIGGSAGLRTAARMARRSTAEAARGTSVAEWLDGHDVDGPARDLAEMLVRTTTYSADFEHLDAGAAMDQLRRGAHGVLYVDGGWQTLVEGLRRTATAAGVRFAEGRVERIAVDDRSAEVRTVDGAVHAASAVVAALGGAAAVDGLVDGASADVRRWAAEARPVRAATLDVALRRLPRGNRIAAYGLGEPTYAVVHSASARLAPEGGALVHCLWYEPDLRPEVDHRARLEAVLDMAQPGWRDEVVEVKAGRQLVVAHDRPRPGATSGTPTIATDLPRLFVAGDWIPTTGFVADAAVGSGHDAGAAAASVVRTVPAGGREPAAR